ncbi:MAG TPA: radical SAM protein [Sumerlaeia bacterium]|nr:radical SAM protein [Sumerlaeia bacterium]
MLFGWDRLQTDEIVGVREAIVDPRRPTPGPFHLEIHPTNRCNLSCFYCSSHAHRAGEILPWDTLRPLLESHAKRGLRFLRLSGGGESLTYPEIDKLIELCAGLGLRFVDVTTNATTLETLASPLIRAGTDCFSISLNEPDERLYARATGRTPEMFHRAIRGIEAVAGIREGLPPEERPQLHIKFFLWKDNAYRLEEAYRLGTTFGADKIVLSALYGIPPESRIRPADYARVKESLRAIVMQDAVKSGPRLAFNLSDESPELQDFALGEQMRRGVMDNAKSEESALDSEDLRSEYCYMGWFSATVTAAGEVYPCCNFVGNPRKSLGNIRWRPLEEIWRGPRADRFRREIRQLLLLRGDIEPSRKFLRFLDPFCIAPRRCPFACALCSPKFYHSVVAEFERRTPARDRLLARTRNCLLRTAHRLRRS